jgi:hypothetical protein
MKKFIGIAAVAALALGFSSCKKVYTCECTSTYTYQVPTTYDWTTGKYNYETKTEKNVDNYTSGKIKKKDAEAWCTGNAGSGSGYTYSCVLK